MFRSARAGAELSASRRAQQGDGRALSRHRWSRPPNLSAGFNTFAVSSADHHRVLNETDRARADADEMHRPMYMVANLAVEARVAGRDCHGQSTGVMSIDDIRASQFNDLANSARRSIGVMIRIDGTNAQSLLGGTTNDRLSAAAVPTYRAAGQARTSSSSAANHGDDIITDFQRGTDTLVLTGITPAQDASRLPADCGARALVSYGSRHGPRTRYRRSSMSGRSARRRRSG